MSDPLFAISVAVLVAAIYLVVLRLIDPNEKEPLWALALLLFIGAISAAIVTASVDEEFRSLSLVGTSLTAEVTKFVAIAIGLAALEGISRLRGWSEFNGIVDGVVYGAAAGLGYAVGLVLVRELSFGGSVLEIVSSGSSFDTLWTNAVFGLREGIFGAIIGAGFGAALTGRGGALRIGLPLAGLVVAFGVHVGYFAFSDGNSVSGDSFRPLVALLLPVALIAALMVMALARERNAIAEELADEAQSGTVTEDELVLLRSPGRRRAEYLRRIASGDLDGWIELRALHNRQVQLALTERRLRHESDPERRQEIKAEVARLRYSILEMRQTHAAPITAPTGEGGAA
jgi:RsiW-degrading membrane proteinase PrsW (M82 family)